ncbi:MAG TPA: hypothetical protein VL652_18495 [Kutzneria sp.]|nr:hypothetical protein [Kutzneria sp.]
MLGVLLAVLASAMNAAASVLQRKADRDESSFGWRMLLDVARRPAWWAGIGSVVLGFALQAVALALSPVSVVQPLLISELPMTLLLASLVFRRLMVALTVAGRRTKNGRRAALLGLATPIWLGHPSSVAQRVLERLDAELSETDENGLPCLYNKVATVAVVGDEDGTHKVSADLFQALDDVGFTIPAGGVTYGVGEAMHGTDFKDVEEVPDVVAKTTKQLAANATHLARVLRESPYSA